MNKTLTLETIQINRGKVSHSKREIFFPKGMTWSLNPLSQSYESFEMKIFFQSQP